MRARLRGDIAGARAAARALLAPELAARAGIGRRARAEGAGARRISAWPSSGPATATAAARDLKAGRRAAELAGRDWLVLLCTVHLAAQAVIDGRLAAATRLAEQAGILAERHGWSRTLAGGSCGGRPAAPSRSSAAGSTRRSCSWTGPTSCSHPRARRRCVWRSTCSVHACTLAAGRPEPALESLELADELLERLPARAEPARSRARGRGHRHRGARPAGRRRGDARPRLGDGRAGGGAGAPAPARRRRRRRACGASPGSWTTRSRRSDRRASRSGCWTRWPPTSEADHERASASLEQALDRAESTGYRRPFLELGAPMLPLLHRQLRRGTAHRSLIEDLLHELEQPRANGRPRARCSSSSSRSARRSSCASCRR